MYYHNVVKIPVWVLVDLPDEQSRELATAFYNIGAKNAHFPGEYASLMFNTMRINGYTRQISTRLPFEIDINTSLLAAQSIISSHYYPYGSLDDFDVFTPYGNLNCWIKEDSDYERLINDIFAIQPELTLTCIFDTPHDSCKIWFTHVPSKTGKITNEVSTIISHERILTSLSKNQLVVNSSTVDSTKPNWTQEIINLATKLNK